MNTFVFLHTRELTESLLTKAIVAGVPIEIDISIDRGRLYVGHPLLWYGFLGKIRPELISMKQLTTILTSNPEHPVVFDIKDRRAIVPFIDYVSALNLKNIYIHVFAECLVYDPNETNLEPHRRNENIPTRDILYLKLKLKAVIIASMRGSLSHRHDFRWIDNALQELDGAIKVVNISLPVKNYPLGLRKILHKHDTEPLQHLDAGIDNTKVRYGVTDSLKTAQSVKRMLH